jgi:tellurite resistance protein TerC
LLAGAVQRFGYLHYGLAAVLMLVGVKMLIADFYHMPIALSLGLIAVFLATSIIASLLRVHRDGRDGAGVREGQPIEREQHKRATLER